jgi:hypothetical protein
MTTIPTAFWSCRSRCSSRGSVDGSFSRLRCKPTFAGAAVLAVSVLLYIAGRFGAELFLTRVSLIGVLAGTVAFVWGGAHVRILAFPLAFLLFMVSLWFAKRPSARRRRHWR